jgi:dTDP-4-dehydrorhamnose 3,5-epimerase
VNGAATKPAGGLEIGLQGVYLLPLAEYADSRGSFSPAWVRSTLEAAGLDTCVEQINVARNAEIGTLRGLHFQVGPCSETKIVQVLDGAIFDALVDLRRGSPTFGQRFCVRLDDATRTALYVPRGMAHGYQTLAPDTTVLYTVSSPYAPNQQGGVRWNDPQLGIEWPFEPSWISDRDKGLPFLSELTDYPGTT